MTQKLEQVLLLLLLILLPSQLALHFWPSWSLVNGIRVDYLSPTLYLTDLIILGLFLSSRLRVRVPLPVILFVVLNILVSTVPALTIYKWSRVLEYFWIFRYLTLKIDWKLKIVNWSLSLSVIWTSFLALNQFILQKSVGGVWWWLGERPLSATLPAIAKVSFAGQTIMRSYATLPHPNALAGFLLIAALILARRFRWVTLLALATISITFSRSAFVLEIVLLLILATSKVENWKTKIIRIAVLLGTGLYFLSLVTGSPESFSHRLYLILNSMPLIFKSPFFGVGLGNFIPTTGLFQPVHNIYLLAASELGIPAAIFVFIWLVKKFSHPFLFVVMALGLVDHYWLTLHQNILLLVLLLSLLYAKSNQHLLRRGSQR